MKEGTPNAVYLGDYSEPDFLIDRVDLRFELAEDGTRVTSNLKLKRNHAGTRPLVLDGRALELIEVSLDGAPLEASGYVASPSQLLIPEVPDRFELEIRTLIQPQKNTSLEGLYKSSGNYCTQCEAQGFRRITYYLDRPDVMARFSTTIVADTKACPVMLSNGNPVDRGLLDDGRHWITWEDPYPKPCYLFALVAGNLSCVEGQFRTASGREVDLHIYVEPQNVDMCEHAMRSLKKAMTWDEEVFGLEYDLDIYMIVGVGDFNMGAMENKGLNVFNTRYVLASSESATDTDYRGIEGVIAHEYFHNWTGNRVTCRDWFQLSLKEGLTVFRDQEFSADMGSRAVKRIDDVRLLRGAQFIEDAGPMAHPVRPQSYIEINNFYTATVYNKGAEVVRMIRTLLDGSGFRRGLDLYFRRHDGQAVTCEDFVAAMEDANGADLGQFRRWYDQAGTPCLRVETQLDQEAGIYEMRIEQSWPATPGQTEKEPLHIPLAIGLLGPDGRDTPLRLVGETEATGSGTRVFELRKPVETLRFANVSSEPVPSLLRGFSAPVKLVYEYSDAELQFLMSHDCDPFNRWEAGQRLATRMVLELLGARADGRPLDVPRGLVESMARVFSDTDADRELKAQLLTLPSEAYIGEFSEPVDVDGIHEVRQMVRQTLAGRLRGPLLQAYRVCRDGEGGNESAAIARRALQNCCLGYLSANHDPDGIQLCLRQFETAGNMTDSLAALTCLVHYGIAGWQEALERFYRRWEKDPLVLDKWFAIQAGAPRPDVLSEVERLLAHPAFNLANPNKVRALLGTFCARNLVRFHEQSGSGYRFLTDRVLELDTMNAQVAARLLQPLIGWRRYDVGRQTLMRGELQRILQQEPLSSDVYEVAAKSLGTD
jgi:aminopeptidase N